MPAPAVPVAARSAVCTYAAVLARPSAAVVTRPPPTSKLSVKLPCAPAGACTRCCAAVFTDGAFDLWLDFDCFTGLELECFQSELLHQLRQILLLNPAHVFFGCFQLTFQPRDIFTQLHQQLSQLHGTLQVAHMFTSTGM